MKQRTCHFALPKHTRLQNPIQFDRVFRNPAYRLTRAQFLLLAASNNLNHSRLGMVVGRKAAPSAVIRNRIKRILRESFRHRALAPFDIVVLAKSTNVNDEKPDLRDTVDSLFNEFESKSR